MTLRDLVRDTFDTLNAHKLRTGLTMFGLAWGVVSITLMSAAGDGLREGQRQMAAKFGENLILVFPGRTSAQAGGERAGRPVWWTITDHSDLKPQCPSCQYILPELDRGSLAVRSSYNSASLTISGSLPPYASLRFLPVAEGRFYSWEDDSAKRRVAFLGTEAKRQLFGSRNALGETVYLGEYPYQVVGVMQMKEQDNDYNGRDINKIYIPFSVMIRDFPNKPPLPSDSVDQLLIKAKSLDVHEACLGEVRRGLARIHRFDPTDKEAANIWDTVEGARAFAMMANGMKYFLGAMGVVTLLLGGIGTMNVMLVAVRERTREIGIRKAVGATSGAVLSMFFLETLIIVFISGAAGLAFAHGVCAAVNTLPMPPYFAGLFATWEVGLFCIGMLGVVAVLSAVYPASRAARIDPIEALRFEAGG